MTIALHQLMVIILFLHSSLLPISTCTYVKEKNKTIAFVIYFFNIDIISVDVQLSEGRILNSRK